MHDNHTESWQVVGASVTGRKHQEQGAECQDAHTFTMTPTGVLIFAVADGAGSASRAAAGAQVSVQTAARHINVALQKRSLDHKYNAQEVMVTSFASARQSIELLAQEHGLPLRDFATTLTVGIATFDHLIVGQLGDGVCVARDKHGVLFLTVSPQRGEYANETHFLCDENALDLVEIQTYTRVISGLAVMTDGLTRLAIQLDKGKPHVPFFNPLFEFVDHQSNPIKATERLRQFLESDRVSARTDDDKTLLLATRAIDIADPS